MKIHFLHTGSDPNKREADSFRLIRQLRNSFGLLILFLTLAACNSNVPSGGEFQKELFFDLEGYFRDQIEQLSAEQPEVRKKVQIGEQEEEKEVDGIDFSRELQIFSRSDINRPSWSDKYLVDSTLQDGNLTALAYTAIDTTLVTRLLEVSFESGNVSSIHIKNRSHSVIAHTEQDLQYLPGKSYRIVSTQKTIGSSPKTVQVEAFFDGNGS